MRKKKKGIRITVLLLLLFLSEEGASYLLEKGESYMVEKVFAASVPAAKPPIDMNVPSRIETATFALGWFWGPDSQFGSLPGVVRTRVGYAGGTKENPTYHDLGDHSETIQIDYDPERITYGELLNVFWKGHNPTFRSWSRQYAAIIFYHNEEQKRLAEESKERVASGFRSTVFTEIVPFSGFTLAEDYHQKHSLQHYPEFMKELRRVYLSNREFVDSTAAARLNGYLGGEGSYDVLSQELDSLGLSSAMKQTLREMVRRRTGAVACPVQKWRGGHSTAFSQDAFLL